MTVYYSDIHGQESVINGVACLVKITDDRLVAMMADGPDFALSVQRFMGVGDEDADSRGDWR